jgi:hypothetical protein
MRKKMKVFKIDELKNEATISIEEAAQILRLSRTKTYEMAKAGSESAYSHVRYTTV